MPCVSFFNGAKSLVSLAPFVNVTVILLLPLSPSLNACGTNNTLRSSRKCKQSSSPNNTPPTCKVSKRGTNLRNEEEEDDHGGVLNVVLFVSHDEPPSIVELVLTTLQIASNHNLACLWLLVLSTYVFVVAAVGEGLRRCGKKNWSFVKLLACVACSVSCKVIVHSLTNVATT